jgi:ribosomal protein L16 Arg81 hydroxylase
MNAQSKFFSLADLLGEHDVHDFMDQYWERQPLHIRPSAGKGLADVLTLADMNWLFSSCVFRADEIKVAKGGNIVPSASYVSEPGERVMLRGAGDYVNTAAMLNHFQQGATLVMSQLNQKWQPLQRLKEGLQRSLSANVVTNVFLSRADSQGFSVHYDSHDVFVIQLEGQKTWSLYDSPLPLPTKAQPFGRTGVTAGALSQTVTLEPGDMLYVPRGLFHEARTSDDLSLHVTLGVHPYLCVDYVGDIVQAMASSNVNWRRSVPAGAGAEAQAGRHKVLRQLLAELASAEELEPVADAIYEDAVSYKSRQGMHLVADHLQQVLAAEKSSRSATYTVRETTPPVTSARQAAKVVVSGCGQSVAFPERFAPVIEALLGGRRLAAETLPGDFTADEKLSIVRKLVGTGVLVAS